MLWCRAVVVVVVAVVSALLVWWLAVRHHSVDLWVYRGATASWLRHRDLYSYWFSSRHLGFTYPPFAAVAMVPLVLVPGDSVVLVNQLVIAAAIVACVRIVVGRLSMLNRQGLWFATAVFSMAVCVLEPVRDTVTLGQINITLAALILADLVLLERGRRGAGIGIGFATAIKLTPGLFIVFLFVAGRRRAATVACGVFVAAVVFAGVLAPATSWTYWSTSLFDSRRIGRFDSATNQSLAGLLARLTNSTHPPGFWLPLVVLITIWALRSATRMWQRGEHLTAFTVVGLAAAVASPISWIHHLWWIAPALLILADTALRTRSRLLLIAAVAIAVLYASGLPDLTRVGGGHHLTFPAIIGENAYAFACLVLLVLLPRHKPDPPRTPHPTPQPFRLHRLTHSLHRRSHLGDPHSATTSTGHRP
jgi:alpha-1,2-mannosyltransferase